MSCVKTVICPLSYLLFINGALAASVLEPPHTCDRSSFRSHLTREGVIAQTGLFPWFGLLKVYLHDMGSTTEAVTGIVLVKDHYAIANADDVAKIPEKIFVESSEAMFVHRDKAQFYSLRGYLMHPEYPANTLAIIDIYAARTPFPILAVCRSRPQGSRWHELYTLGYTDDNGPLEKFLYKMKFVDAKTCKDFYDSTELQNENLVPENRSTCASARNLENECVWDTGAALVSNVTGHWALVALGVRGPGCAAPARFISLAPYWPWILSQTSLSRDQERHAFQQGFKEQRRRYGGAPYLNELAEPHAGPGRHAQPMAIFPETTPETQDVPLHEVRRQEGGPIKQIPLTPAPEVDPDTSINEHLSHYYQRWLEDDMFKIERHNDTQIHILPASGVGKGKWGNCSDSRLKLVFKDHINVTMERSSGIRTTGSMQYKISLFDLWFNNYTCVTAKVYTLQVEHAYLQYTIGMHDGGDIFPWTPENILQSKPLIDPLAAKVKPYAKMNKNIITSPLNNYSARSMMLYLKVLFAKSSRMEIAVYGLPKRLNY